MTLRVLQFLKMTWMFSWRLTLLSPLLLNGNADLWVLIALAIITAGVLAFGFNKAVTIFPIISLIRRKQIIIPADASAAERSELARRRRSQPKPKHQPRFIPPTNIIHTATGTGRITGYEPRTLEGLQIAGTPRMHGTPGASLASSEDMDEEAVSIGMKGEKNFAKALTKTKMIHYFQTVWSVPVPDYESFRPASYHADIDCVLATGNTLFLVDLKQYKSGNVRYYHHEDTLYCEDIPTGAQVGAPKQMSRNMIKATMALDHHFPEANIVPVVVFMPTDKGEGIIDNVYWPGGIPAMNLTNFLDLLHTHHPFDWKTSPHAGAFGRISHLHKLRRKKED